MNHRPTSRARHCRLLFQVNNLLDLVFLSHLAYHVLRSAIRLQVCSIVSRLACSKESLNNRYTASAIPTLDGKVCVVTGG